MHAWIIYVYTQHMLIVTPFLYNYFPSLINETITKINAAKRQTNSFTKGNKVSL